MNGPGDRAALMFKLALFFFAVHLGAMSLAYVQSGSPWMAQGALERIRALSAIGREIGQCLAVLGLGLLASAWARRTEEGRDLV